MIKFEYILLAFFIATASAQADGSPAANLCDGFQNQPVRVKAERAIVFYQAVTTEPLVKPPYSSDCIDEHLGRIEPALLQYCQARAAAGHDALARELRTFETEFQFLAFDCEHEESRPFFDRIEAPIYCRDIEQYLRDSIPLLARIKSPDQVACMEQAIPAVAARLQSTCTTEPIPGPTALHYWDVLVASCPESDKSEH